MEINAFEEKVFPAIAGKTYCFIRIGKLLVVTLFFNIQISQEC